MSASKGALRPRLFFSRRRSEGWYPPIAPAGGLGALWPFAEVRDQLRGRRTLDPGSSCLPTECTKSDTERFHSLLCLIN